MRSHRRMFKCGDYSHAFIRAVRGELSTEEGDFRPSPKQGYEENMKPEVVLYGIQNQGCLSSKGDHYLSFLSFHEIVVYPVL